MTPFANEAESEEIAGLKIENRRDQLEIYGSGRITRDRAGLAEARRLMTLLAAAIAALEADPALPDRMPPPRAPTAVANPFE